MIKTITDADFESETKEGIVLIDFWAVWCSPCRTQSVVLERLSESVEKKELKIFKMNVDENPETPRRFGIMSIPTLIFKKNGTVIKQVSGMHTKDQIQSILDSMS